jgi:hypothetical protein
LARNRRQISKRLGVEDPFDAHIEGIVINVGKGGQTGAILRLGLKPVYLYLILVMLLERLGRQQNSVSQVTPGLGGGLNGLTFVSRERVLPTTLASHP